MPACVDASISSVLQNSASALQVPGFASMFLTLVCSYSAFQLLIHRHLLSLLSAGALFPSRELFMKGWKQEKGISVAAHHQESSLNLALQSVTFHLHEPPAQGTAFLLPREPPMKKTRAR